MAEYDSTNGTNLFQRQPLIGGDEGFHIIATDQIKEYTVRRGYV
ncbi:hypothetical protein [Paenibacillus pabuli]|nr:hypothetical protein [Paenibacillus pabuli]